MKWNDIQHLEDGLSVRNKLNDALEFSINPPIQTVTNTNYAINGATDKIILVTTGGSDRIITLPELTSTDCEGNVFIIIKVDDGVGRVVVNGYGSDQIMGQAFVTIGYQWENYKLLKSGSIWIPIF